MRNYTSLHDTPGYFVTMGEQETERLLRLHQCYEQLHKHSFDNHTVPPDGMRSEEQILDVACGTGGWARDIAQQYPASTVIGIDMSPSLLAAAAGQAQGLENVRFQAVDVREPLPFPEQTFALVHVRALQYGLHTDQWPAFVTQCYRVLQSAGRFSLTEGENVITTTQVFERLSNLHVEASRRAGYSFSSVGSFTGITARLVKLLKMAGDIQVQSQVFAIDCSAGTEAHADFVQYFHLLLPVVLPFLLTYGVIQQEEGESLMQRALEELEAEDFCGIWYFRTVWGQKPS